MTAFDIMSALNDVDEKLLDAALEEKTARSGRRYVKIAAAAIIAAALLIGAAIAASSDGFLSELFGESYDIIGDYVMMEPISVENEYARLTVESALSDGFNAYVIYSVERLDGGTLEGVYLDMEINPLYSTGGVPVGYQSMGAEFITGNETPQKEWNMWLWSGKMGIEGVDLRLLGVKNSLEGISEDFGEVRLKVPFTKCPVKLAHNGGDAAGRDVFADIILSPIGFQMSAWPNLVPMSTDGSGISQRNRDYSAADCSVVLLFADDTERDISDMIARRPDGECDIIKCMFETPIDIDKVDALLINGQRYELEYGQPKELRMSSATTDRYQMEREYLFCGHEPTYPLLKSEGEHTSIETESIWTDGSLVELSVYVGTDGELVNAYSYMDNGMMEVTARDKKGNILAVGVQVIPLYSAGNGRYLYGYLIQIGGKAENLTMSIKDTEIEIPLDMKKLGKLPQGEPFEPQPTEKPLEGAYDIYQESYDNLFGYRTPEKVDITADNGEYSITIEYLWQMVYSGSGKLKAMVKCEQLDGEKYERTTRPRNEIDIHIGLGGEYRASTSTDGSFGNGSWIEDNVRYVVADMEYIFPGGESDTVRLTWTPPAGERIVLDIPIK